MFQFIFEKVYVRVRPVFIVIFSFRISRICGKDAVGCLHVRSIVDPVLYHCKFRVVVGIEDFFAGFVFRHFGVISAFVFGRRVLVSGRLTDELCLYGNIFQTEGPHPLGNQIDILFIFVSNILGDIFAGKPLLHDRAQDAFGAVILSGSHRQKFNAFGLRVRKVFPCAFFDRFLQCLFDTVVDLFPHIRTEDLCQHLLNIRFFQGIIGLDLRVIIIFPF